MPVAVAYAPIVTDFLTDLALPRTDAGVAVQLALVIAAGGITLWLVRGRPHYRLLTLGSLILAISLMGLRALH